MMRQVKPFRDRRLHYRGIAAAAGLVALLSACAASGQATTSTEAEGPIPREITRLAADGPVLRSIDEILSNADAIVRGTVRNVGPSYVFAQDEAAKSEIIVTPTELEINETFYTSTEDTEEFKPGETISWEQAGGSTDGKMTIPSPNAFGYEGMDAVVIVRRVDGMTLLVDLFEVDPQGRLTPRASGLDVTPASFLAGADVQELARSLAGRTAPPPTTLPAPDPAEPASTTTTTPAVDG